MRCRTLVAAVLLFLVGGHVSAQPVAKDVADSKSRTTETTHTKKIDRAGLEQSFQQTLTGATLIGHFVVTGDKAGNNLRAEKYSILSVKKIKKDLWEFRSRIEYGDHDITVPLSLPVYWAGDTPVITLDKIPVPGLGTFSARVLVYQDHYAGTWSGGGHGGLMFGRIERAAKAGPKTR